MSNHAEKNVSQSIDTRKLANGIRVLAMDAVEKAQSGHPGMPMGMADVATVLFTQFMKFDPQNPLWPDRDRFVLSAGHGSMLLYALCYLLGYEEMTLEQIKNFRTLGALTAGHPEYHPTAGIETTTGPLGQGLANAVGFAFAEKLQRARFTESLVNHHTYAIVGDGCLMEGISQEAISFAGHHQLNKLIVLFDDNHISIDGPTSLSTSEDTLLRFKAANWDVSAIDGHDPVAISTALRQAQSAARPTLIACRTIIGYGAPTKGGSAGVHGSPLGSDEIARARRSLAWDNQPFDIPSELLSEWRHYGKRGHHAYESWKERLNQADPLLTQTFLSEQLPLDPQKISRVIGQVITRFVEQKPSMATRQSSGEVLDALVPEFSSLIGGSADLTGSNNTKAKSATSFDLQHTSGNYVHYGVREHAMAAIMNGLCLHGGIRPFGGTFLVFSDYCKPAIRLSALMHQPVIYVMTHDSIGLGEDGPTHQPIEQLAGLRAIPNLHVFRPADAVEVAECWALALMQTDTPSLLALTRQKVPTFRTHLSNENKCAKGAYVVKEAGTPHVILCATGSEVSLALETARLLEEKKILARVISMPCTTLFDQQDQSYKTKLLGDLGSSNILRASIEAASTFGWERYVGHDGLRFGIDHFGASAPFEQLYDRFGLSCHEIMLKILTVLKGRQK